MADKTQYDFNIVKKDLEATLLGDTEKNNGTSTLTIEEKLNLFPEFEGDKKLFKSVEKNIISNNDVLKKKDFTPLSYKPKEESNTFQSETPSTLETTTTEIDETIKPSTEEVNVDSSTSESQTQEVDPITETVQSSEPVDSETPTPDVENPLEDPNLTAGGTEEIQSDVSTQSSESVTQKYSTQKRGKYMLQSTGETIYPPDVNKDVSTELSDEEDKNILGSKNNPVQAIPRVVDAKEGRYYQNQQDPSLNYIFHDGKYVNTETTFYKDFISKDIDMPLSYDDWIIDGSSVLSLEEINKRKENPDEFGKTKEDYVTYFEEQTGIKGQFSEGSDVFIPKDYSNLEYPDLEIKKDFHLGKPTEDVYQNMLDYPELIMYDFYSGDASTLFVPEDIDEDYKESSSVYITPFDVAESTAPKGSSANPYNIDYGYQSYGVDVNLNDILKSLNKEINKENFVNWIPASERGYDNADEMKTYGFGLDQKEIVFKYNKELGRNELYMTNFSFNETGEKIYDEENENLINTFTFKKNLEGTARGDIYKGLVLNRYASGIDLSNIPSEKMEIILDYQYNEYKSFKSKYYQQMFQNLPESILDLEKGYEFEDIEGFIKEAKTGFIKDLVRNNIYVESAIQGNVFEDYVQNNLYHDIRSNFVNNIYSVIEDNMGDETQQLQPMMYGVDGGIQSGAPRHESDIYRDAIETELDKESYDWMGDSEKESLGALIMRKYKKEKSPEFEEIKQNKINNSVEKYNQESEKINKKLDSKESLGEDEFEGEDASRIIFIPPGENQSNLKNTLEPIKNDLRENKNLSEEDIDNYIQDVYGVNYNTATQNYEFTNKYKSAYGEIFGKAETETWKEWNADNPEWNQNNILAEAWEGTITAWALGEMGIDTKNADYDIEYGWWEEHVIIPTFSIVIDPATYGTGMAGSFVAKTAFNGVRTRLVSNMAAYEQKLIVGGMSPAAARTTTSAQFGELYTKIGNMQNVVGSGLGLSSYTTSAEVMMYADENFEDFKVTELLKNGLVNFTLGGGIGHLGNLTRDASSRLNARYGKTSRQFKFADGVYTIDDRINPIGVGNEIMLGTTKAGMYTGALGVEAGAFAVAHYDSSISAQENFARSFSLIFGLKTVNAPLKLMKKNKGEGRIKVDKDFQLTEADILTLKSNGKLTEALQNYDFTKPLSKKEMQKISKEYFDYLEKEFKENLTPDKKGEMTLDGIDKMTSVINSMPLNVQYKYLDAKNYRVEFSEIDALPFDVSTVAMEKDGVSKTLMQFKDFEGNIIETKDIKNIPEIASGNMSIIEYDNFVRKQSQFRMSEILEKDEVYKQELSKNLKQSGVTEKEYDNWTKGKYKKGGKYENKELQDAIGEIVELSTFEKKYSEKKALENFNTLTLQKAIENLQKRGVDNPSGQAIANECMSVINRIKIERERINKVNSEINNANEKHNEALDNNQFIQGYEKDGIIYNNPVEGSRPVTTNITKENSINLKTVKGQELTKDHKKTLIYELEKKGELTQELKDAITETKDFDSFVKLVTEKTSYESIIFKNETQLLQKSIERKENNSAISTSKEKDVITDREVTESDVLSKDNYENLLLQAETPTQRQLLEDGLRVLNKGGEVVIHNNVESFNKILEKDGTKVTQEGYEGSAYIDSKGVIHINKKTQRGLGDIYHEWKHLEFRKMKKNNPELYNKLLNETSELLKNEGVLVDIKQIVKEYKLQEGDYKILEGETKEQAIERATKELQLEEATIRIAEALRSGTLSEKDITAIKNSKVVDGVKTTLNDIFKEIGVEYRVETNPEVIGFLENYIKDFNKTKTESLTTTVKDAVEGEGKLKIESKRLETLVKELETLKEQGAEQSLIDAKQVEVNKARVKQAQAETGIEVTEKETKGETTKTNELVEVVKTTKNLLENADLSKLNSKEVELVNTLKDLMAPEGKESSVSADVAVEIANIVADINTGAATPKSINEAFVRINNMQNSEVISKSLMNSLEKHGDRLRFRGLKGSFPFVNVNVSGKIGGIETRSADRLDRDLATKNLSMIESYFFMEKDGLLTKHIIGPMQEAHTKYTIGVKDNLNQWFTETKVSIPTPGKRRKMMTKMGLLLAQRERNGIDGKDVWSEILNGKDLNGKLTRGYGDNEFELINDIYNGLPKDKNGKIDIVKAFENLSVTERKILETYEAMLPELKNKQKLVNEVNGVEFLDVENYFPRLYKKRYESKGKDKEGRGVSDKDFLNNIYSGNDTKIISDRGKDRTLLDVGPMDFNLDRVMQDLIMQTNRDYVYGIEGKRINSLLDNIKELDNISDGAQSSIKAIQDRLKSSVELQLHQNTGNVNTVMSSLFNVNYATNLISVRRLLFVEPLAETLRIGSTRAFNQYKDVMGQVIDRSNRGLQQTTSVGERLHGVPLNSSLDIMKRTNSVGLLKSNRIGMEYENPRGENNLQSVNNYLMGMTDRAQMNLIWMPAFKNEFNKSGIKFNEKEYRENPDGYYKKYQKIFRESARIADRQLGQWKNESTKGGKRSQIRVLGIGTLDATSNWAPIATYMSNFGAQEYAMLSRATKNIIRGDNTSRALAGREFLGIFGSGMMYGTLSGLAYSYQNYFVERQLLEAQLDGNDVNINPDVVYEKIKRLDEKWEQTYNDLTSFESVQKEFITNGMFLLNSKYSQSAKLIFGATLGAFDQVVEEDAWIEAGGNWAVAAGYKQVAEDLYKDISFSRTPENPGKIFEAALPQVMMLYEQFVYNLKPAVSDYFNKGVYNADFEEEFKEEINAYNFYNQAFKTILMAGGKALPFQKDIDQTFRTMYNFYGLDTKEELKKRIKMMGEGEESQVPIYQGGPGDYQGEPGEYEGGPGDVQVTDPNYDFFETKEERRSKKEKDLIKKYGIVEWWNMTDTELKQQYKKEELREILPPDVFEAVFPN